MRVLSFSVVMFIVFVNMGCLYNSQPEPALCKNGIIKCEIVAPDEAGKVAGFAAQELQELLSTSLGDNVPIVKKPSNTEGKTSIILGANSFLKEAGIDIKGLPRDAFIIKSSGNNIFIAGIDDMKADPRKNLKKGVWAQHFERGTLFGTYEFLERFAGVRFYFPGKTGTIIPPHKNLSIPAIDLKISPDYTIRNVSIYSGLIPEMVKYENKEALSHFPFECGPAFFPFQNLCYYRMRFQTNYIPNCHGLGRMEYVQRFAETHPEYFTLMADGTRYISSSLQNSGQVCLSSPIKDEIYKDAEAFLTGQTPEVRGIKKGWNLCACQPGYFNLMPQDGFYFCRCPECWKHFSQGPKKSSDFIWDFACDIAERLEKNNISGKVTMAAYTPYIIVPERKLPKNMLVMLCEVGPWALHTPKVAEKESQEIKAWQSKQGEKIYLWNYINKYSRRAITGVPSGTPECVGRYYKMQAPYITGAFLQSETDNFVYNYLAYYVFSKVAWNNSTDVNALLKEHYQKMFGPAADVMEKIYQRIEKNWLKIIGKPITTDKGPINIPVSDYELWESIYSEDEINSMEQQFAEADKLTKNSADDNARVHFMHKNLLDPLKDTRRTYIKNKNEIDDLNVYSPATDIPVNIDGVPDEKAWAEAEKIYLRAFGGNNAVKDQALKTTVRSIHDKNNLYIMFECEEPEIDKTVSSARKHDDNAIWQDSSVEIFLNPSGDRKTYYQILVNASGSVTDLKSKRPNPNPEDLDLSWTSGTTATVKRNRNSWTMEAAIPLKNLPNLSKSGFPVNFNRNRILDKKTDDYAKLFTWSPFLRNSFHEIDKFGSLRFDPVKNTSIIKNGDFAETRNNAPAHWNMPPAKELNDKVRWAIVTDEFVKGGCSLRLQCIQKGDIIVSQYLPPLMPDTEYLLTFFIKTSDIEASGDYSGACINIYQEKNRWFPEPFFTGSMEWTKFGFKFRTSKADGKIQPYIRLTLLKAKGTVWFDDVKLSPLGKNAPADNK